MSDALAKLLDSPESSPIEREIEVCLAQGVPTKIGTLASRLEDLDLELAQLHESAQLGPDDEAASDKPRRKMAEGPDPRIAELEAEIASTKAEIGELNEVMRAHLGKVRVEMTISQGEWRLWADENPARIEDRDEHNRPLLNSYDIRVTRGYCNASALLARVGDFVTAWDGEPLSEGQWERLAKKIAPGDMKDIATQIVSIYEGEGSKPLPKSLSGLFSTASTETS